MTEQSIFDAEAIEAATKALHSPPSQHPDFVTMATAALHAAEASLRERGKLELVPIKVIERELDSTCNPVAIIKLEEK